MAGRATSNMNANGSRCRDGQLSQATACDDFLQYARQDNGQCRTFAPLRLPTSASHQRNPHQIHHLSQQVPDAQSHPHPQCRSLSPSSTPSQPQLLGPQQRPLQQLCNDSRSGMDPPSKSQTRNPSNSRSPPGLSTGSSGSPPIGQYEYPLWESHYYPSTWQEGQTLDPSAIQMDSPHSFPIDEYSNKAAYESSAGMLVTPQGVKREGSKSSTELITMRPKKSAHNLIEKRYRNNLNDKIQQLKDAVPALRPNSDSEELDGLSPAHKLNKATILAKAVEYIGRESLFGDCLLTADLENRTKILQEEKLAAQDRLMDYERMVSGQMIGRIMMGGMAGMMAVSSLNETDAGHGLFAFPSLSFLQPAWAAMKCLLLVGSVCFLLYSTLQRAHRQKLQFECLRMENVCEESVESGGHLCSTLREIVYMC